MMKVAMARGWDRDTAEDIAQEAWTKAFQIAERNPERVEEVLRLCGWLAGITKYTEKRFHAKQERRDKILRKNANWIGEVVFPSNDTTWASERRTTLVMDIAKIALPPRQQQVIQRRLIMGMTDAETAKDLGISEATVRWHRNRAMRTLTNIVSEKKKGMFR